MQNQIKRRLNAMDQCQAETETRWSTTLPSPGAASCLRGGPRGASPCPAWWATPPPGSASPWATATPGWPATTTGASTPPRARPRRPPPSRRARPATTSGRSASPVSGARPRVSQDLVERKLGGYSAITWGAGRPPPPPPRPQSRGTLSAPPPARLIMALSFLTHFPTSDQLVFQ